jgi:hypothetical protein
MGCSSPQLRKFDQADVGVGISREIEKKFEIKDVKVPVPSPIAIEQRKKKSRTPVPTPVEIPKIETPNFSKDPMPFAVGEKLQYDIRYLGVTAGTLDLEILPNKFVNDHEVYHFHGLAKTTSIFSLIYRVNDQLNSYSDIFGFHSYRFALDQDESKQTKQTIELFDHEKLKSYYWSRTDHVEKGYSEKKEEFPLNRWARDGVGMLYFLRVAPLPDAPGKEYRMPIVFDGKPWEGVIRFDRKEKKNWAGREWDLNVYHLQNYENGELKNKDNWIWIAADHPSRYILRVETKVRVGSFAVALEKFQPAP